MGSSHLGFPFWPSQSAQLYTKRSSASAGCVRGPCFKLPTRCAGFTVHSAVELTGSGSGRVPGHFSAISEFPKWRKYLISLSFRDKSSVRPVQVGGFEANIVVHRSTAVRGRGGPPPPWESSCRTRTGPVEADGTVDAQNAPTAPWKTLRVFHELPQGLSHRITHAKPRKAPKWRRETRIDPISRTPLPACARSASDLLPSAPRQPAGTGALLRGSKTDPQRPLPTDPLTTDSVRRRPTKLSHLIEDVTCEDGLRLLPRSTARSKALPDDQLVPEEGVLHTGLLMVARVLLPLSPSSLLHLSDRAVARGRSWSPSRHGGCPGRWNDDRRATRTRSLVDATRVVGRVRREAGDVAFDLVDQIEGRRRVVNMPAGQGVSDDHARSVDAQMKRLPAAYTASAMFHGRPFTFTHSREPGTVDDEMYACARGEAAKCKVEVLTTP